jgi:uncharacterized protein (TIGR02594 family)
MKREEARIVGRNAMDGRNFKRLESHIGKLSFWDGVKEGNRKVNEMLRTEAGKKRALYEKKRKTQMEYDAAYKEWERKQAEFDSYIKREEAFENARKSGQQPPDQKPVVKPAKPEMPKDDYRQYEPEPLPELPKLPNPSDCWHFHPLALIEHLSAIKRMAPWLRVAWAEYEKYKGRKETDEPLATAIRNYFSITNQFKSGPSDAWCAAFVNWCLNEVGFGRVWAEGDPELPAHVRLGWYPNSWKKGEDYGKPFVGAIAVMNYGQYGHVGFVVGETDKKRLVILGGNQAGPDSPRDTGEYINLKAISSKLPLYYMKPKSYVVQPEEEELPPYDDSNLGAELNRANTR